MNVAERFAIPLSLMLGTSAVAHAATNADAGTFHNVAVLSGPPGPELPQASLVQGPDGNFYGTTYYGGTYNFGTVFRVTRQGAVTVLHSFSGGADGEGPAAPLIVARDGSFYGTTMWGGSGPCTNSQGNGCGTVFRITADGTESIVYSFQGGADGYVPTTGVIEASNGDLFGATNGGGLYNSGTIFRITAAGAESVIHTFNYGVDGGAPSGLVQAPDGTIYGTGGYFFGSVWRITPAGDFAILYSFGTNPNDAAFPNGSLTLDREGNLYGTATNGGLHGFGAVFEVTPSGSERVVYSFSNAGDGGTPIGTVYISRHGKLYGLTRAGGSAGYGVIYELTKLGAERTLYSFASCTYVPVDGPGFDLISGHDAALYGASTGVCGPDDPFGSIFRIEIRDRQAKVEAEENERSWPRPLSR